MSYINSRMKEEIAVLATLVEYCEDMAHSEAPEFKRSRRQAQAMARNAQKVFDAAIEDLDTDQLLAILRLRSRHDSRSCRSRAHARITTPIS